MELFSPQAAALDAQIIADHWARPDALEGDDREAADRAYWLAWPQPWPTTRELDRAETKFAPPKTLLRRDHRAAYEEIRQVYGLQKDKSSDGVAAMLASGKGFEDVAAALGLSVASVRRKARAGNRPKQASKAPIQAGRPREMTYGSQNSGKHPYAP